MVGQVRNFEETLHHLNYWTAGSSTRTPKITTGISISINVKPRCVLFFMTFSFRPFRKQTVCHSIVRTAVRSKCSEYIKEAAQMGTDPAAEDYPNG